MDTVVFRMGLCVFSFLLICVYVKHKEVVLSKNWRLFVHPHLNLIKFTEHLLVFLMVFWFGLSFLKHPFSLQEFRSCFCCDVTFCIHILKVEHIKWCTLRCLIIQGYSKWLSGFEQLVIHNKLEIGVYVFFYLIEHIEHL